MLHFVRSRLSSVISKGRTFVFGAGGVVVLAVVINNALRIVSTVTLTRLLDAEAFGVTGIIGSVGFIVTMVSDIGIIPFIIRHASGGDSKFLDEVWTTRFCRGLALTVLVWSLSGIIANYIEKPHLQSAIAIWSLTFTIDGLSSLVFATALRDQKVARLSVIDVSSGVVQVVFSIILTLLLRSYWGMIFGSLISSAVRSVMSYIIFPGSSRRFRYSTNTLGEIWKFSRFIVSSSIFGILISQTDKVFFARLLSLKDFGYYTLASTLATAPLAVVGPYVERILYPAFSATARENSENIKSVYYGRKRQVSRLFMFLVGGFVGSAPLVVAVLYTTAYQPVAFLLRILALGPLFAFNNWAADHVLIAIGQAWSTVAGNAVRFAWLLLGGAAAILTGEQLLLVVAVGTMDIAATPFHWIVLKKFGIFNFREEAFSVFIAIGGVTAGVVGSALILRLIGA